MQTISEKSMMEKKKFGIFLLLTLGFLLSFGVPLSGEGEESNPSFKRFRDNDDGTIADRDTGLMWQKEDGKIPMKWETARRYCSSLRLAGYSDWRLPRVAELKALSEALSSSSGIKEDPRVAPFQWSGSIYWSDVEFHDCCDPVGWVYEVDFKDNRVSWYRKNALSDAPVSLVRAVRP